MKSTIYWLKSNFEFIVIFPFLIIFRLIYLIWYEYACNIHYLHAYFLTRIIGACYELIMKLFSVETFIYTIAKACVA